MSLFSELHNNGLSYLLSHSKLRVKKCSPFLIWNVLLVSSLLGGQTWQAYAQQMRKTITTQTLVSHEVCVHALLVQQLQSVIFQYVIWHSPKSEKVQM